MTAAAAAAAAAVASLAVRQAESLPRLPRRRCPSKRRSDAKMLRPSRALASRRHQLSHAASSLSQPTTPHPLPKLHPPLPSRAAVAAVEWAEGGEAEEGGEAVLLLPRAAKTATTTTAAAVGVAA